MVYIFLAAGPLSLKTERGTPLSAGFVFTMLNDATVLVPQVFMMAQQNSNTPSPLAHFVAATAVSRSLDLVYWFQRFHVFTPKVTKIAYSGWVILIMNILAVLVVCDFFYYYARSILTKRSISEEEK